MNQQSHFTTSQEPITPAGMRVLLAIYDENPLAVRFPVLMEDEIIHTDEHPFCGDETCPCMAELYDLVEAEIEAEIERQEQETTGTHAPDCRCAWCEPEGR